MRKVSNLFDIGKSTVSKVIRRVTQAISQFFGNLQIFILLIAFNSVLVWCMVHMLVSKSRRAMPVIAINRKGHHHIV